MFKPGKNWNMPYNITPGYCVIARNNRIQQNFIITNLKGPMLTARYIRNSK